ncbi:MAG TPA: choice-of-anchor Q domain-containing protein [Pyrinomonadaceae bacterium]|nr:choice-of-anchor Q domain-containing protein [Pyrinomonadaceae bacterium]
MKTHRFKLPSSLRLVISEGLIITLITLLSLPAAFATPREAAKTVALPLAGLIVVNVSNDADNLDPTTGCDTDAVTAGEQCSLRAAIQRANALAGDDEINFNIPSTQPNCDPSVNRCTINLTKNLPDLGTNIRIVSPGIDLITVRRNTGGDYRIFRVIGNSDVTLSGLRIENGRPSGITAGGGVAHEGTGIVNVIDTILTSNTGGTIVASGGALANSSSGTLNVINSSILDNKATASGAGINNGGSGTLNVIGSFVFHNTVTVPVAANTHGNGGGISNSNQGTVNVVNSVISENVVTGGDSNTSLLRGGGVMNASNGIVRVTGSVIFDNFALKEGGGISNTSGTLEVTNSTITRNRGVGGGLFGQGTVSSSIIAKNNTGPFAGSDVSGNFTSSGFNLVGVQEGSTGFSMATDLKGTVGAPLDPKFDPNGFPYTILNFTTPVPGLPLCGSPAIDKGASNGLNSDLRGTSFPRIIDDPEEANASDGADIGALERQTACAQIVFTVNTTSEADDVSPGDGNCDTDANASGSQCSLRAALKESNAIGGDYTINFAIPTNDPGFDPGSARHTINLTGPLPEITESNLTINGPGKDKLTIRRNTGGFYRIFTFRNVVETASISGLTVSNAFNSTNDGGAISFTGKSLTINSCAFSNNIAAWSGGALFAMAALNVTDSNFNDNFSSVSNGGGGAIHARGKLSVSNSTFNNNVANSLGGAINVDTNGATGDSNITNSTFDGNAADAGGGVSVGSFGSAIRIENSKFTRNTSTLLNSRGGAIYQTHGTLHLVGSTLTDNEVFGLAINMGTGSTMTTVTDSTIARNTFGGIETESATVATSKLNIINSTISGNTGGAGLTLSRVTLNVSNSTIAHNENVGIRGTLTSTTGMWTVKSSIIAANGGFSDVSGAFTSAGFNLIGKADGATGFTNGVNNDQVGTSAAPVDPKLDGLGLRDNGGPTHTIALQPDSPAIDKGSADGLSGPLANDQRGVFARTFDDPAVANAGDGTDIGAFELQPGGPSPTPTPTPDPSPTPTPSPNPSPSPSPTPTPTPQPANLVVTTTPLVRTNCGAIVVGVTVKNVGGATANNVKLTTATLVAPTTNGTPLPQTLGNLAPGQSVTTVMTFSGTNNPPKQKRTLTLGGTYNNGATFSGTWKVTLP